MSLDSQFLGLFDAVCGHTEINRYLITLKNSYKWGQRLLRGDAMPTGTASDAVTVDQQRATLAVRPTTIYAF